MIEKKRWLLITFHTTSEAMAMASEVVWKVIRSQRFFSIILQHS